MIKWGVVVRDAAKDLAAGCGRTSRPNEQGEISAVRLGRSVQVQKNTPHPYRDPDKLTQSASCMSCRQRISMPSSRQLLFLKKAA